MAVLPEVSGMDVLRLLRGSPAGRALPVILLTARRDEIDRVLAFELGADDYVTKPFSPREIVLRVRAVLRRSAEPDKSLTLTVTEFRLLSDLLRARGRVRTRDRLLAEVWGYEAEVVSRTVDTHVRRLRDKLGPAAQWLETVRGVGYRIRQPEAH
jgi:two-component system phosphate regulon response regulator PhoB